MIVTGLEAVGKNRSRVYLDEELAFVLYKGELSRYGIKEGAELSEDIYREILDTVLTKRAKLRCMNLLKSMDRTEFQLRQKLRQGDYPEEVAERAIAYVKKFGYVNDRAYALRYIESRQGRDARRQIACDLRQKGISQDIIQEAFEEAEPQDEEALIRRLAEKKHIDPRTADRKERQRLYGFLMRKGFSSEAIGRALRENVD